LFGLTLNNKENFGLFKKNVQKLSRKYFGKLFFFLPVLRELSRDND